MNTVGSENDNVAGKQSKRDLVVFHLGEKAQGNSGHIDFGDLTAAKKKREGAAGVRDTELAQSGIVNRKMHGNKAGVQTCGEESTIQDVEHFGGRTLAFVDHFAKNSDSQRTIECSGGAFAGDVAHGDAEA